MTGRVSRTSAPLVLQKTCFGKPGLLRVILKSEKEGQSNVNRQKAATYCSYLMGANVVVSELVDDGYHRGKYSIEIFLTE